MTDVAASFPSSAAADPSPLVDSPPVQPAPVQTVAVQAAPVQPAPASPRRRTRRWVLVGAAAVTLGGGAGVGTEFLRRRRRSRRPAPVQAAPPELTDAVAAEQRLIADLDATTGGSPAVRTAITAARANHAAHLTALRAVINEAWPKTRAAVRPAGTPRSARYLRAAEQQAALVAARRASGLNGQPAALLASIAACEATHAELLR